MLYSTIDRNTWDEDEWVKNLPPVTQSRDAHLLHIYLFSNRRAGITACYTISLDRAARECHFEGADDPCFRAAWICLVRDRRIRYFEEHGIVWVPAFIRHQRNPGPNFRKGIADSLRAEVPPEIAEEVVSYNLLYGIELTLSETHTETLSGRDTASKSNTKSKNLEQEQERERSGYPFEVAALKAIPGYLFDEKRDRLLLDSLAEEHPKLDLAHEIRKLRSWLAAKGLLPLTGESRPRTRVRNWMQTAEEIAARKSAVVPASIDQAQLAKDEAQTAELTRMRTPKGGKP